MKKPPTFATVHPALLVRPGVYTFSNGSEHECWASVNCWECRWYDQEELGGLCAFEGAAMLGIASPDLARLFGWVRRADNDQDGERFGWDAPDQCAFFRERSDDDGPPPPPPPPTDPLQLVLIADPTEDIGQIVEVPAFAESVA